jgi:GT2 family glycosyltransferase
MIVTPQDYGRTAGDSNQSALFIIVNFHCEDDVERLVWDLGNQHQAESAQTIVVDNSAVREADRRLTDLTNANPRLRVFCPGRNLGYFGGASWGLQVAAVGQRLPDWIVVTNPDIRIPMRDFLKRLYSLYAADAPAVVAPAVRSRNNLEQRLFMQQRPTRGRIHLYKWVFRHYWTCIGYNYLGVVKRALKGRVRSILGGGRMRAGAAPRRIYAPHGSFILFHRSYFEDGGTIRHGSFLFGEEVFVGEQVAHLGKSVIYDPRLVVHHEGGKTTGLRKNRAIAVYQRDSSRYLADELFR